MNILFPCLFRVPMATEYVKHFQPSDISSPQGIMIPTLMKSLTPTQFYSLLAESPWSLAIPHHVWSSVLPQGTHHLLEVCTPSTSTASTSTAPSGPSTFGGGQRSTSHLQKLGPRWGSTAQGSTAQGSTAHLQKVMGPLGVVLVEAVLPTSKS